MAQVMTDGTTLTTPMRDNCLPSCRIVGESISRGDRNLFHSFEHFNIRKEHHVIFDNPPGTRNILVRVTGDRASRLRGTLEVDGTANFFLMNPNGITFGRGAQLQLQGSFIATTAHAIEFDSQGEFSTLDLNTNIELLTIQPSALRFLNDTISAIHNQTSLSLNDSPNLSVLLAGGLIRFEKGEMWIDEDKKFQLQLVAIDSLGEIPLNFNHQVLDIVDIPSELRTGTIRVNRSEIDVGAGELVLDAGQIFLTNNSHIEVSNPNSRPGLIQIEATDNIYLHRSSISSKAPSMQNSPRTVQLIAGNIIHLHGNSNIRGFSEDSINGIKVDIEARNLALTGRSTITTETEGAGSGGEIFLNVDETIILTSRSRINSSADTDGPLGNAGNVTIQTQNLQIDNSEILAAATEQEASGGNVDIQAHTIHLENDASIVAGVENQQGGNITIASDLVIAFPTRNNAAEPRQGNDIIATASATNGRGGNINISARGIFGLEERAAIDGNGTNDIDASSRFGPDGVVNINRLAPDPSQGLLDLPSSVVNVAGLVEQGVCRNIQGSSFRRIGRGGVAPSARESLSNDQIWEDWRLSNVTESSPVPSDDHFSDTAENSTLLVDRNEQPTEAQGWIVGTDGMIRLVANRNGWERSFEDGQCAF